MFGAFLYLVGCTLRNRLFQRLRRLRHPRYLIGLALGVGYVWLVFLRPTASSRVGPGGPGITGVDDVPLLLASLGLAALTTRWWLFGSGTGALAFAPAEAQFLFPAPLRRRDLLAYKVVAVQVPLLTSTILFGVIASRWSRAIPIPLRMVGLWVLLLTLFLNQLGASLVRVGVTQSRPGARRPFGAVVVFSVVGIVLLATVVLTLPTISAAPDFGHGIAALVAAVRVPAAAIVLWPFRAVLAPAFASTSAGWISALFPALAILFAHYLWLLRLDVPFEDAAAEASVALADRLRVLRQRLAGSPVGSDVRPKAAARRAAAWFHLRPTGRPAVAIVWKNLISLQRRGLRGMLAVLPILAVVMAMLFTQRGVAGGAAISLVGYVAVGLAVTLALFGSAAFRIDLRQDVGYLPLLRTYPLSGRQIVAAEVASSVLPMLVAQFALLAFACVVLPNPESGGRSYGAALRLAAFGGSVVALLALDATTAIVGNATALLFPAARGVGAGVGTSGIEMAGQMFLARITGLIALTLTLTVPVAGGVAALWSVSLVASSLVALAVGVLVCALGLAGEIYLGLRWLGRVFDRTDAVAVSAVD